MKEQKILANRIKELCRARQMSYYLLAYCSAVPLTTLMHIINCSTKNPGIFTIIRICNGLQISMTDFFDTAEFREIENEIE